jgi:hypothetical protein
MASTLEAKLTWFICSAFNASRISFNTAVCSGGDEDIVGSVLFAEH